MTASHAHGPKRSRPHGAGRPTDTSAVTPLASVVTPVASAWVRVTCPDCGVVRVRADHVVVRNCADDQSWSYRARCSSCDIVFIGATPVSLALPAVAAGLMVEVWTLPKPRARREGSRLQVVDALELHLALLESDWFDELVRVEPLEG